MVRPDFKQYRGAGFGGLIHSAKGSTWEEHKYVKRIDGVYYYPDGYEGGRNISSLKKTGTTTMSKLENMSGMKREYLEELKKLGLTKGYDSKEYKELLNDLSEGDPDQARKMTTLLKRDQAMNNAKSNSTKNDDGSSSSVSTTGSNLDDINQMAMEVIRGNFGNGQERKDKLGDSYDAIQKRVNELLKKSDVGSTKISEAPKEVEDVGKKVLDKASTKSSSTSTSKTADIQKVFSVYNNHRAKR